MVHQLVQYGTQLLLRMRRRAASVHSDPREALRSAGLRRAGKPQYLEELSGFYSAVAFGGAEVGRGWLTEATS